MVKAVSASTSTLVRTVGSETEKSMSQLSLKWNPPPPSWAVEMGPPRAISVLASASKKADVSSVQPRMGAMQEPSDWQAAGS